MRRARRLTQRIFDIDDESLEGNKPVFTKENSDKLFIKKLPARRLAGSSDTNEGDDESDGDDGEKSDANDEDDDGDDVDDDDFAFFLDEGGDEWELMSESGARSYLASLRVIELKEQLRERRVPVSGTKAELVDRLLRYRVAP